MNFPLVTKFAFSRYGDRSPLGFAGRLFAMTWVMTGLVIIAMTMSAITTSLTTITLESAPKLYGTKVTRTNRKGCCCCCCCVGVGVGGVGGGDPIIVEGETTAPFVIFLFYLFGEFFIIIYILFMEICCFSSVSIVRNNPIQGPHIACLDKTQLHIEI